MSTISCWPDEQFAVLPGGDQFFASSGFEPYAQMLVSCAKTFNHVVGGRQIANAGGGCDAVFAEHAPALLAAVRRADPTGTTLALVRALAAADGAAVGAAAASSSFSSSSQPSPSSAASAASASTRRAVAVHNAVAGATATAAGSAAPGPAAAGAGNFRSDVARGCSHSNGMATARAALPTASTALTVAGRSGSSRAMTPTAGGALSTTSMTLSVDRTAYVVGEIAPPRDRYSPLRRDAPTRSIPT